MSLTHCNFIRLLLKVRIMSGMVRLLIQKLNPNLQFKIYPVPNLYGKKTTVASYWVNGVSSKSTHQKETMEFMQYLAQKSTAHQFYTDTAKVRAFGEPYARKDLQQSLQENQL